MLLNSFFKLHFCIILFLKVPLTKNIELTKYMLSSWPFL